MFVPLGPTLKHDVPLAGRTQTRQALLPWFGRAINGPARPPAPSEMREGRARGYSRNGVTNRPPASTGAFGPRGRRKREWSPRLRA